MKIIWIAMPALNLFLSASSFILRRRQNAGQSAAIGGGLETPTAWCVSPAVVIGGTCCYPSNPSDCHVGTMTMVSGVVGNSGTPRPDMIVTDPQTPISPIWTPSLSVWQSLTIILTPVAPPRTRSTVSNPSTTALTGEVDLTTQITSTTVTASTARAISSLVSSTRFPSSSTTNATTSNPSDTTTQSTSISAASTSSPSPPHPLTSDAKMGIAVGATISLLTLLALLTFFLLKRHRRISNEKLSSRPRLQIGNPTNPQTMSEAGRLVPGIHPRIGSMGAISVARLRQQARGSGSRFAWDENGRWIEQEGEVPDLPSGNISPIKEDGAYDALIASEDIGNTGVKRKSGVNPRESYIAHSRPE